MSRDEIIDRLKLILMKMSLSEKATFLNNHYKDYVNSICGINTEDIMLHSKLLKCEDSDLFKASKKLINNISNSELSKIYLKYI